MTLRKATKEDVTLWVLSGQTLCLDCLGKIDCNAIVHCKKCQINHQTREISECPNYLMVSGLHHYRKDQNGNVMGEEYMKYERKIQLRLESA